MEDREFAVILEGLRSDFRAFKEGLDLVWNALNELTKDTNKRFTELTNEVREGNKFLQAILGEHEDRLRNHEERLTFVEKNLA